MNTEQERAAFEAWGESIGFCVTGKYAETVDVLCAESAFKAGYKAGRAALAAQPAAATASPSDEHATCNLQLATQEPVATPVAAQPAAPAAPAAQGEPSDPLQGAANRLLEAVVGCNISTLKSHLKIDSSRAKRLMDAARAAQQKGASK